MNPHAVHHHDTSSPSDPVLPLPPDVLLLLAAVLGLRIAVSKPTVAALGAHNQDDVVSEPGLQAGDHAAVLAGQRLLQIDDLGLDMTQDVHVSIGRGEGQDATVLLDQPLRLRVDGVEGRVRGGGGCARLQW